MFFCCWGNFNNMHNSTFWTFVHLLLLSSLHLLNIFLPWMGNHTVTKYCMGHNITCHRIGIKEVPTKVARKPENKYNMTGCSAYISCEWGHFPDNDKKMTIINSCSKTCFCDQNNPSTKNSKAKILSNPGSRWTIPVKF